MEKYYITTTIPYMNGPPHIGHALEYVQADILARWHKLLGKEVFFLTGSDEHGTKIYRTAKKANLDTKKFVDNNVKVFKELIKLLEISNDEFIRTTDSKKHWPGVHALWKKLEKNGDIYKKKYTGLYCSGCERFVTEKDLVNGKCPDHPTLKIEKINEENYFFRLSKYSDKIKKLIESDKLEIIPKKWKNNFLGLIRENGLLDVSFSRDKKHLPWGIPVPGDESQVMYVWCDALTNYLTGIGFPDKKYKKFWPADVHVVGKDMLRFHTGIWPGMLLSAGLPLPDKVIVHGFLITGGRKMSKSSGNILDPVKITRKYGSDAVRYFLARNFVFGDDGDFSEKSLVDRYNNELANELGNLLSRSLSLLKKYEKGIVPKGSFDKKINSLSKKTIDKVKENLDSYEFHNALNNIWRLISETNKYIQDNKPWENPKNLKDILYTALESLRIISWLTFPFIPNASKEISKQLGIKDNSKKLKSGTKTKKGKILFKKLEYVEEEDPFSKVDLKVAEVKKVEDIPKANKLLKLQIEIGNEKRQLVAGLKPYVDKKSLVGKKIIVVANLKPAKLCGELSQGMLLAASKKDKVEVIFTNAKSGEEVVADNIDKKPSKQIKIDEFFKFKLKTDDKGNVVYGRNKLKVNNKVLNVDLKNAKVQ